MFSWIQRLSSDTLPDADFDYESLDGWEWAQETLAPSALNWAISVGHEAADKAQKTRMLADAASGDQVGIIERKAAVSGVLTTLSVLVSESQEWKTPKNIKDHAVDAYRRGVPLPSIIRFVWVHHNKVQEELLVEQRRLDSLNGADALQILYTRMNSVVEQYIGDLIVAYKQQESEGDGASPERKRVLIEALLDGEPQSLGISRYLGLDLDQPYGILLLKNRAEETVLGSASDVDEIAREVAKAVGLKAVVVQIVAKGVFVIVRESEGLRPRNARQLLRLPSAVIAGYSSFTRGELELPAAIDEARAALRVAEHPARGVDGGDVVGPDVGAIFSFIDIDSPGLARFLRAKLGSLALDSRRNRELRDTLESFIALGRSRKATGKELTLAPNTVAYRVDQALGKAGITLEEGTDVGGLLAALRILKELPELFGAETQEN
ncbi:PucR family transcriptional regulator [Corynebacterium lubricantis]|uniref:PucR family transcriptional regulator n=1 Tax=Corynebacterium lubricantis TaxID=541095 RepID=UPI00035F977B|nr:helix-turn-helix domain-containing protein [Corynebacterium lubricantis]